VVYGLLMNLINDAEKESQTKSTQYPIT